MQPILPPTAASRPHLCTIIDLANARAARTVGLPVGPHAFRIGDRVALADGAVGFIVAFRAAGALLALAGRHKGIRRFAALSTLRALADPPASAAPPTPMLADGDDGRGPSGDAA
jgi:hypothetical protein